MATVDGPPLQPLAGVAILQDPTPTGPGLRLGLDQGLLCRLVTGAADIAAAQLHIGPGHGPGHRPPGDAAAVEAAEGGASVRNEEGAQVTMTTTVAAGVAAASGAGDSMWSQAETGVP